MRINKSYGVLLWMMVILGISFSETAMAEENTPGFTVLRNDTEQSTLAQFSNAFTDSMLAEIEAPVDVIRLPLGRIHTLLTSKQNTCSLMLGRSQDVDYDYTWVAAISGPVEIVLFQVAGASEEELNIPPVVQMGGTVDAWITSNELEVLRVTSQDMVARMLVRKRTYSFIDYSALGELFIAENADLGFVPVKVLVRFTGWAACSRDTDPRIVKAIRDALDAIKQNGRLLELFRAYEFEKYYPTEPPVNSGS